MQALPKPAAALALLALSAVVAVSPDLPAQQQEIEPKPAIQARLADESLLLDVIRADEGFVAVGSRGHVLLSADGRDWRQAASVPVQATLTRVTRVGRRFWSVGHDATIISTTDAGETWFIQHFEPEAQEPLLDVLFINPNEGFAIGAYGRFMSTVDGGINWTTERLTDRVTSESIDWADTARRQGDIETLPDDDPGALNSEEAERLVNKGCYEFGECHLNAIIQLDSDRLMITAERGYGFRSSDRGETWDAFRFPYTGSLFGLVEQQDCVLAFGLRGHVLKSCDFGDSWRDVPVEGEQTLMGGTVLGDGTAVLVGAGATRLRVEPDGGVQRDADQLGGDYAAVTADGDGELILVGEDGVEHE
ncbi:MAG: hypothetical protein R6V61_04355 [Wenzhouxiangellaceae bacterium]